MMKKQELIQALNKILLEEMPQYLKQAQQFETDILSQRQLLQSLMNLRPPFPLKPDFLILQNELLTMEKHEKAIIDIMSLPTTADPRIVLWQGDITRLDADAIVNAANSALLGCFHPCHGCIDNAIHSAAGLQLRKECYELMELQGHEEPAGSAKLTQAYNLPSKYVLHTVGPIVQGPVTQKDCDQLKNCYLSCLELAELYGLQSLAFCCISTGEFHFPNQTAAEIAVNTVLGNLQKNTSLKRVVFNVFKTIDLQIYQTVLNNSNFAHRL